MAYADLAGQTFGKLTAIRYKGYDVSKSGKRLSLWECKCECGATVIVRASSLRSGNTKSCGCLRKELGRSNPVMVRAKHNATQSRLFRIWRGIKSRCFNPNTIEYERYGGRGITMSREWVDDFPAFQEWALNNGYSDTLTIDRIDNDGDYEPSNCRWSTNKEQQNNTRFNRLITYNGNTHTLKQWSELLNIPYDTLWRRLANDWSIDRAFTIPLRKQRNSRN